jgi:hypothetical protein
MNSVLFFPFYEDIAGYSEQRVKEQEQRKRQPTAIEIEAGYHGSDQTLHRAAWRSTMILRAAVRHTAFAVASRRSAARSGSM